MTKKTGNKLWRKMIAFTLSVVLIAQCVFCHQNVSADDSVYLEITGYQISTSLEAYRTLYSIADPSGKTEEVGLVYGLADSVTEAEMIVGSSNSTVYSYAATSVGKLDVNYSEKEDATTYVRTMELVKTAAFYNENLSIRAYAKLKDGSYVYSDISTVSVYRIATTLYKNCLMSNIAAHNYLHNNIIKVVDSSYAEVDYDGNKIIVPAETVVPEVTTKAPEETTTVNEVEPTAAVEPTTAASTLTPETADWSSVSYLAGTAEEQYKVIAVSGVKEVVNVQQPGFATATGIYVTFADADLGAMTVDGNTLSADVDGAGIIAHLSNFTDTYSTVVIKNGAGSEKAVFFVYNAKAGSTETTTAKVEETTTVKVEETTTVKVEETTTAIQEITTAASETIVNGDLSSKYDKIDSASSSSVGSGSETTDKLFDGNVNTKAFIGSASGIRIAWQMTEAVVVNKYTLTTGNDTATYSNRNPVKWQLYGSNDATSWIQIDAVSDGGMGAVNYTAYSYDTDIQDPYQYYLLQVENTGGGGLQLSEISLNGSTATPSANIGAGLNKYYDSLNTANTSLSGHNSEVPANLFDRDTSTKMFSGSKGSVAWKMDRATTVYSYTLTTGNDNSTYSGRNPKAWVLYGSSDGNSWDPIDIVKDSGMKDVNYESYAYTVDKVRTYQYFKIDFTELNGSSFQLSEIEVCGDTVSPSKYDILLTGDWDMVTSETYVDELIKLFYNSYPRLYKRWGDGSEPKTITFKADSTYDGVAYCAGTTVCVSTRYANSNPHDIGFFSHEITHSVQQYGSKLIYADPGWWTENMANYGGFRYFHWSNPQYVQVYKASDTSLQDWGWQKYGNNKWFFAYMDAKYPTTKNSDGSLNYGLIDSINNLIKTNTGDQLNDDPDDTSTPFNQMVYKITGYDCMESLRKKFVSELQNGTWAFTGFANYTDNWLTEDIEGVDNPEYPMLGEKTHGNTTASQLASAVTSGTNLCSGASILKSSGQVNDSESASMLVDGNLGSKWCATSSNVSDGTYLLNQVKHWAIIDLGSEKTFNTYTLYNTQSQEGFGNTTEWEILVSNDAKTWTSVDYQGSNNSAIASFNIGSQKARYVMIKVFNPDNGSVGTVRLYEFQLYNR